MRFCIRVFSAPARKPQMSPDTKVDGFPSSIHRYKNISRAFQCATRKPEQMPRPPPLAILRERLFLNSGPERTFGDLRHAPSLTAGDGLISQVAARILVPGPLMAGRRYLREPGTAQPGFRRNAFNGTQSGGPKASSPWSSEQEGRVPRQAVPAHPLVPKRPSNRLQPGPQKRTSVPFGENFSRKGFVLCQGAPLNL